MARILAKFQGAAFNSELLKDLQQNDGKYVKTAQLNSINANYTGKSIGPIGIMSIGEKEEESFNVLSTKIVLGLYYKIMGKIVQPEQRVSLTFFTPDRNIMDKRKLEMFIHHPLESDFNEESISNQFYYQYVTSEDSGYKVKGSNFALYFHLHIGIWGFGMVYSSEDFLHDYDKIVRTPFEPIVSK